jgi:hypothetical protein
VPPFASASAWALSTAARGGEQRDHLAVAGRRRLAVVRHPDQEERADGIRGLPARPALPGVAEAQDAAELGQDRSVEREGPVEIADADMDVGQHGGVRMRGSAMLEPDRFGLKRSGSPSCCFTA